MAKGSSNEREKAKEWSLWWSEGERDDLIWRVMASGGRATNRAKRGQATAAGYGDLTFTDPIAEPLFRIITIELKRGYPGLDFMSLLDKPKGDTLFRKFWNQVSRDAEEARKDGWGPNPVLITHRNRREPLISMKVIFFFDIEDFCGEPTNIKTNVFYAEVDHNEDRIISMRLKDFFEWCSPEFFKQKYELMKSPISYSSQNVYASQRYKDEKNDI